VINIRARRTQAMKKIFYLLPVLFVLLASLPTTAQAQEKVPEELKYYDAQIEVMLPKLDGFEREYFELNKRYYQALTSHSIIPEVPMVPDKMTASPTDQVETLAYFWTAKAFLPEQLSWAISIDTYDGPVGAGYVLNVKTMLYKETWMRSVNVGPEDYRSSDWQLVRPDDL
jgi:hypothetical protein